MNTDDDGMIPAHNKGGKLDTDYEMKLDSEQEAKSIFNDAVQRLLDVNSWDKICGPMSAVFRLTDERGREVSGPAQPGRYFRIDVPGPGPSSGDGFDWVKVEAMDDKRNPESDEESMTIRVRPASSPTNTSSDTAHFFSDEATSSFRVVRTRNVVRAEVHGRNEVPNTDTETSIDKLRNAVVGTGARAGISSPQWKSLVNGLIKG